MGRQVAVVTGGASGIGKALAREAVARGMAVAIADIEGDRAVAAAAELGGTDVARGFACNVIDPASLATLAESVTAAFGGANYLFNNAGVAAGSTVENTTPTDAAWVMSVNFMGVFHGIQAFLPLLRAAAERGEPARFINTGSENSLGLPFLGPTSIYTASKHAVLGLSDALRRDLKGSGIEVSILCPGLVQSEIYDSSRNRPDDFGGQVRVTAERAARSTGFMQKLGQEPSVTAKICFDGIANGEFVIACDPRIREFAERRHTEVAAALDLADSRTAALGESYPAYG